MSEDFSIGGEQDLKPSFTNFIHIHTTGNRRLCADGHHFVASKNCGVYLLKLDTAKSGSLLHINQAWTETKNRPGHFKLGSPIPGANRAEMWGGRSRGGW